MISAALLFCWYVKFVGESLRVEGLPLVWASMYDFAAARSPARVQSAAAAAETTDAKIASAFHVVLRMLAIGFKRSSKWRVEVRIGMNCG